MPTRKNKPHGKGGANYPLYRRLRRVVTDLRKRHGKGALRAEPTFRFPLPPSRRAALRVLGSGRPRKKDIRELLNSDDRLEMLAGLHGLGKLKTAPAEDLPMSRIGHLLKDKDPEVREATVRAVGAHKGLAKHIIPLLGDEKPWVRREAARAVGAHKGLAKHVVPLLGDKYPRVRREAARAVGAHEGFTAKHVVPLLGDTDRQVRAEAARAVVGRRKPDRGGEPEPRILGSRRPHLATPYRDDIVRRLDHINDVSEALKKYPGFTGIVVLGSTAKGYAELDSDLDVAVLGEGAGLLGEARGLLGRDYRVCGPLMEGLTRPGEGGDLLFRGLFFGRRESMETAQRDFLRRATPAQWEEVRERILAKEGNILKAAERLGVGEEELGRLRLRALLQKVPPPLGVLKRSKGWE